MTYLDEIEQDLAICKRILAIAFKKRPNGVGGREYITLHAPEEAIQRYEQELLYFLKD